MLLNVNYKKWLNGILLGFLIFLLNSCATGQKSSSSDSDNFEDKAPIIQDDRVDHSDILVTEAIPNGAIKGGAGTTTEWNPNIKICLVLGPGMARGFAHAGVLEAVAEMKLVPHCIVGVEMGALVGALYASTLNINTLQWQLFKLKRDTYLDFPLFAIKDKIAAGEKIYKFLQEYFSGRKINELKIPFAVVATDSDSGNPVVFRDDLAADAIAASIAIPNVFKPHEIHGRGIFTSGAASSPLPIREAMELGATHVIAIDLLGDQLTISKTEAINGEISKQFITARNLSRLQRNEAQFVIAPDLHNYFFTDFDKRVEIISSAKRAALEALLKIRASLQQPMPTNTAVEKK